MKAILLVLQLGRFTPFEQVRKRGIQVGTILVKRATIPYKEILVSNPFLTRCAYLTYLFGVLTIIMIFMSGCAEKYKYEGCHDPIVVSDKELRENYPKIEEGKKIGKAANIYNYKDGEILLINEKNIGIHVVKNSIKGKVTKGNIFINLPGNIDMAVKDGYLYADSFMDLVVFDIRDIDNIKMISRKIDIFPRNPYQGLVSNMGENECYSSGDENHNRIIIGMSKELL